MGSVARTSAQQRQALLRERSASPRAPRRAAASPRVSARARAAQRSPSPTPLGRKRTSAAAGSGAAAAPVDDGSRRQLVALLDLDDTLLDINSGWLWALREWRGGRIRGLLLTAAWWMLKYSLGYVRNLDAALEKAVSTYAGVPEQLIRTETDEWFAEELAPRLRPGAAAAIAAHRAAGHRLVLASSTTQFAAAAAVRTFGLDESVNTVLSVDDASGLLTGRVASMAFGRAKAARVREWAARKGVSLRDCVFYTDSYADRELLSAVGRPVCVCPDRRLRALAQASGWEVVDWGRTPAPLLPASGRRRQ